MPKVSIFQNIANVSSPEDVEILEYLENTREGKWEDMVTSVRIIKNKEERDSAKRKLPTTTLSGTFSYRRDNDLKEHSGYINADADHVENIDSVIERLKLDPYVFSCFYSTSGDGLRILFLINPKRHRESYYGISKYLNENYGIIVDPNGVSPSKPYIVSFDPNLYINYNKVKTFASYPKETTIKDIPNFVHTAGDFDEIIRQISSNNKNICEEYVDWLKVGFAISSQFGESGESYYHKVSSVSPRYKYEVCKKQYKYCLKAKGSSKVGISTFYYLAKQSGLSIVSEQTKTIVRATKNGKRAGLSKEKIIENLEKFENISDCRDVVENVFLSGDNDDFEESPIEQLEFFIKNNYDFRLNEVTGFMENGKKRMTENDMNGVFISAKKQIPKIDFQLMMRLLMSDFIPTYNPFLEFFESDGSVVELPSIPVKDQNNSFDTPLISKLASCIINDEPLHCEYFLRKWLVGMVSAMHKVHSPLLLCLLGKQQGTGKTEFFRRLLPKELSDYYAESKLDKDKDDELLMTESILIVDDELGGKSKQDNLKLKDLTSKQYFSLRRPYGKQNEKILRIAVLAGTSNFLEVLSDTTGNRRIIPIEVHNIDKEKYNSINKKELFQEMYQIFKKGFDWRITSEDNRFLNKDEEKYEMISIEKELLEKHYRVPTEQELETGAHDWFSTTDIKVYLELVSRQRLNVVLLGRTVGKLGYRQKTKRVNGATPKMWMAVKITNETSSAGTDLSSFFIHNPIMQESSELPVDNINFG